MKRITIFILLSGIIIYPQLSGQSVSIQLKSLEDQDNPEGAFELIDQYTTIYTDSKQWDSLVYILHQKSRLTFRYKSIDEAGRTIEETESIAQKHLTKQEDIYTDFLFHKSDYLQDIGSFLDAEKILRSIIKRYSSQEQATNKMLEKATADLAFLFLYMNKAEESEKTANSVYESIINRGDTALIISILQPMIIANLWQGKFDEALSYATQNVAISKEHYGSLHPNYGRSIERIASIYNQLGQVSKALENYNQAKNIHLYNLKKNGFSRRLGTTISNIGHLYSNIGEYRLAIDHLLMSYDMNVEAYGENSMNNLWYYSNLSTVYRQYHDYDKADYYINKAFKLIETNDQSSAFDRIFFLGRQAEMLYSRDAYEEALPKALEVYNYLEKNDVEGSLNDRLHIINLIYNTYLELNNQQEAKKWALINQAFHDENLDPYSETKLNVLHGYLPLLQKMQDTVEAYRVRDKILSIRNKGNKINTLANAIPSVQLLIFSTQWSAFLKEMANTDAKYKDEYFEFLKDFEQYYDVHISTVKTNSSLALNEKYIKRVYAPAIEWLHDKDPLLAFLYIEKVKSFGLRQILQSQLIDDPNLPVVDFELSDDSNSHESQSNVDVFFQINNSLDSVAQYKQSLLQENPDKFEKYFGVKDLTIEQVQEFLEPDELLVEYYVQDTSLYAFFVDKEKVESLSLSYLDIESKVKEVLKENDETLNSELRALILPADKILNFNKLRIITDGLLSSLSFEQLLYDNQPLLFSKNISYGLSASILRYQQRLTAAHANANQFLGLTPGFSRELKDKMSKEGTSVDSSFYFLLQQPFLLALSESLSRSFSGETLEEGSATEHAFNTNAQDYRILHIATHGILNDKSPLFSKLILAKDSLHDGYLHAYELYGKNLNADLAVLSACSSGAEATYASEGIISLAHAFTHAGCPAVVMTKWDVDEKSTSQILASFYANLKKGQKKSHALRDAKIEFLNTASEEFQKPYYWAGLVLIGDDSALFDNVWYKSWLTLILAVILIGWFIYFLFYRSKRKK